jgi:predicted Zn-dependent protease
VGLQMRIGMLLGDAGGMADLAGNLSALHFARSDEWSADEGALETLMRAGIAPSAMASAFGHLAESSPDRTPGVLAYLSTHPPLAERIELAKKREAQWAGPRRSLGVSLPKACAAAR